jgi:hypothetical protein
LELKVWFNEIILVQDSPMSAGRRWAIYVAILSLLCLLAIGLWNVFRVLLAFGLIGFAGRNSIDRATAMRSGYEQIPQARQIDELLGKADHSVMNEGADTEEGVKEEWISEVYFGGRYELVMTVDIRVDRRTSNVSKVIGTPRFRLLEIESVELLSGGRASISYRGSAQRQFGSVEWERVVDANGDFSVIGIEIEKSTPILNFDELVQESQRRARLRYSR